MELLSRDHTKLVISHVVQQHLAGEQETHWDKTNKELTSSKMVIFFVCLVPVRFLLTSKVFLYHVTDELQRAYNYIVDPIRTRSYFKTK